MGLTYKRTETVVIDSEVDGIEAGIDSVSIEINHEDGAPITEVTPMDERANQKFRHFWETIDFTPDTRIDSTPYILKDQMQPTEPNTYRYYCIEAGDSYLEEAENMIPDEDTDGMLDGYEFNYGLDPYTNDSLGDWLNISSLIE